MVKAIVGANWGDEGKGKITDMLAEESDIIVRFQGGANAGHTIINDYGSEDLVADLVILSDGTYELQQKEGSSIKIARNRKWVKIPKNLVFIKEN